jgi:hypothetical protein
LANESDTLPDGAFPSGQWQGESLCPPPRDVRPTQQRHWLSETRHRPAAAIGRRPWGRPARSHKGCGQRRSWVWLSRSAIVHDHCGWRRQPPWPPPRLVCHASLSPVPQEVTFPARFSRWPHSNTKSFCSCPILPSRNQSTENPSQRPPSHTPPAVLLVGLILTLSPAASTPKFASRELECPSLSRQAGRQRRLRRPPWQARVPSTFGYLGNPPRGTPPTWFSGKRNRRLTRLTRAENGVGVRVLR